MKVPISCNECTNSFCNGLSSTIRQKLCKARIWVNYYKKQQQLFFLENRQVIILEKGVVMPLRSNAEVRQQSVDLMRAGDLLGIVNLFAQGEREAFSILPLTDSAGCMIPVHTFEDLVLSEPEIATAVIRQYSERYSRLVDNLVCKTLDTSADRIKHAIKQLKDNGIESASHEEIALLSGMNRVTVTKIMPQMLRDIGR